MQRMNPANLALATNQPIPYFNNNMAAFQSNPAYPAQFYPNNQNNMNNMNNFNYNQHQNNKKQMSINDLPPPFYVPPNNMNNNINTNPSDSNEPNPVLSESTFKTINQMTTSK